MQSGSRSIGFWLILQQAYLLWYLQLMMPMVPPARGYITEMENIDFGDGAVDAERLFQRAVYLTGFTNRIVFVPADEPGMVRFYYTGVVDPF